MTSKTLPMLLGAAGLAFLCAMDAVIKYLNQDHAVLIVVIGRYLLGTVLALMVWWGAGRPRLTREMAPAHLLRGAMIAASAFLFYWSLTVLTLAEAITLSFITPLLTPPLAWAMLGERMRWQNFAAGVLGFVGVLVAVQGARISGDARLLGLAAVFGASLTYAVTLVLLRARAAVDGSVVVTLMGSLVPLLLLAPALLLLPATLRVMPALAVLPWFVLLGLLGNLGVQLLSRGYARADAQTMAPVEFTALPWAALLGWLFFDEAVAPAIWLGGGIIAAACLWSSRAGARVAAP
jgi:S-adenosylmethionine uptake transporter